MTIYFYGTRDQYGCFSSFSCGTTGTGKNMLGIILMKVRATLRERQGEQS